MFMVFGAPLFTLAVQTRITVIVAQSQQPVNGLLDHLLLRLGAAAQRKIIHRHQLSYRNT
ncbi:hypothetical protein D3C73_1562860 [compost metagenome]